MWRCLLAIEAPSATCNPTLSFSCQSFLMTILSSTEHYQDMDSFWHDFVTWQHPTNVTLSPAHGIYHLKCFSNFTLACFKAQPRSPTKIELPDVCFIHKIIQNEMPWAPLKSENFITDYKIKEFCGIYSPTAHHLLHFGGNTIPDAPPPLPDAWSLVSVPQTCITMLVSSMFSRTEGKLASKPLARFVKKSTLVSCPSPSLQGWWGTHVSSFSWQGYVQWIV